MLYIGYGTRTAFNMSVLRKSIAYIFIGLCYFLFSAKTIDGRVAGKVGGSGGNYYSGKSYSGINDELIMVSIGMAIVIAVLITLALCYIAREKCQKHREYYVTA
ncbi:uncharacterized protein LOC129569233 [Sitodiplosis mosellana]|uniref:uncharacterized protein LOC129569233 n=1 Tax=Sitodiplosis mosellana TaxID=263140 RepID=UPI0024450F2D|nr:uncharacterized protein LOC129569233 [Sitodiplosis mosellana]XP_055303865.1 uncharacterized protein LOC129569233 [Sitodiplosis mosellana]